MLRRLLLAGICAACAWASAQPFTRDAELDRSVEQLRHSVGRWRVVTEFLNPDGSVARSVAGSYEFTWVIADRVVSGRSDIPQLGQSAAILFYVRPSQREIEMTSVGEDGRLWVMTGKLGDEVRFTPEFSTAGGGASKLRFTRFNVTPNGFESRMDYTDDGGRSWKPGNRQRFERVDASR
jgi:hypothetical protein